VAFLRRARSTRNLAAEASEWLRRMYRDEEALAKRHKGAMQAWRPALGTSVPGSGAIGTTGAATRPRTTRDSTPPNSSRFPQHSFRSRLLDR
jgi:hypothetical protein